MTKKRTKDAEEEEEDVEPTHPNLFIIKWSLIWLGPAVLLILVAQYGAWYAGWQTPFDRVNEAVFRAFGGVIAAEIDQPVLAASTPFPVTTADPRAICGTEKALQFRYNPDGLVGNIDFPDLSPGVVYYIPEADYVWWKANLRGALVLLPQNLNAALGQDISSEAWNQALADTEAKPCLQIPVSSDVAVAQITPTSASPGIYVQPLQFVVPAVNQIPVAPAPIVVEQQLAVTPTPNPEDFLGGCTAAGVSDPTHCAEIAKQLAVETGSTAGVLAIAVDMSARSNCRVYLRTAEFAELISAYTNSRGHGFRVKNEGVQYLRLWVNGIGDTSGVGEADGSRYKICVDQVVDLPDRISGRDWEVGNVTWTKAGGLSNLPFAQGELYGAFVSFAGPIGLVNGYYESAQYLPGVDVFPVVSKQVIAPPPASVGVVVTPLPQPLPTAVSQVIAAADLSGYLAGQGIVYLESPCLDNPATRIGEIVGYPANVRLDSGRGKSVYVNFSALPMSFKGCGQPTNNNSDFSGFSRVYGVKLVVTWDNHAGETDWYCVGGLCFYPFAP